MTECASIRNLDTIKSMLLITVVLGHVSAVTLPSLSELNDLSLDVAVIVVLKGIAGFGREAAFLFVLFSGYATAHHFRQYTQAHAASSIAKRLNRLYPPFAYALVVTIALDAIGSSFAPSYYEQAFPFIYVAAENSSTSTLLCNLAMLQPTACHSYGTNGPLWTIGYLMQFYFVSWFLRAMTKGVGTMSLAGCVLAVVVSMVLSIEWAALFALWIFGLQLRISLPDQGHGIPSVILTAVVVIGLFVAKLSEPFWSVVLMAPVGTALLLLSKREWRLATNLIEELLNWLHRNSFPIYLLHMPVLAVIAALATQAFESIEEGSVAFFALTSLTIILSISLIGIYRHVENLVFRK